MDSHNFDLYGDSPFFESDDNDDSNNKKLGFLGRLGMGVLSVASAGDMTVAALNIISGPKYLAVSATTALAEAVVSSTCAFIAVTGRVPFRRDS